jgi:hypothetical protein
MSTKKTKNTRPGNVVMGDGLFQVVASSVDPTGLTTSSTTTTSTSAYSRPSSYATQCYTAWNDYDGDPLFGYLIDRIAQYGANGTKWYLKSTKEQAFWDEWGRRVNPGMIDVLPGLDEVGKWLIKTLTLTGMAPVMWEWQTMNIEGVNYEVPKFINVLPSSEIELKNESYQFGKTTVQYKSKSGTIPLLRNESKKGSFILKYNHTPADMLATGSVVRTSYGNVSTTLYPKPPFSKLHEDIDIRMKLREMDRDTILNFLNRLYTVKIGDKDHAPQPERKDEAGNVIQKGTIEEVADRVNDASLSRDGSFRTLFLPYYVDIEDKTVSAEALMNFGKYIASTLAVLQGFGIFLVPSGDARMDFTDINTQNFEQMVDFIRIRHISRFIEGVLCKDIVDRNSDKLTEVPSLKYDAINTKTDDFRNSVFNLMKMGAVDKKNALQFFGMNKQVVVSNLREEIGDAAKDKTDLELFNINVPVIYKQQVAGKDGETKTDDGLGTNEGGRPSEGAEE